MLSQLGSTLICQCASWTC